MRILKIFVLCFFCASAYSQDTEQQLWNSLQSKMAYGVKGNFQMTKFVSKKSKTFFSEGTFEVSDKNGIIWQIKKPIESTVTMNMDSLRTFFSGDYQSLKERFFVQLLPEKGYQALKLQPKENSMKKVVESVELRVANDELKGCLITWGNKDRTLYEFSVP